jgi:hypothetical protein
MVNISYKQKEFRMNLTKVLNSSGVSGGTQNTQVLTAGASSTATTTPFTARKIRIATTSAIYVNFGETSGVTATTSDLIIPASTVEVFTIEQGVNNFVAVLQVTATGQVSVTEVA